MSPCNSPRDRGRPTAAMARNDPNAFLEHCFTDPQGRPMVQAPFQQQLQQFLSDYRRALIELPRDHGKTTQVCARLVWELGRDPGLRIKIVCASAALAVERGRFVRVAIAQNPRVHEVFPLLRPLQPWCNTRLSVRRLATVIGPSVATIGVGAASTGSRADLLVCDDIVDVKSLFSATHRRRVAEFFRNNLMNLLESDGTFWGLFTPWHRSDLNAELKREIAYAVFRRAVGDDLEPVWHARWPREALAARRDEIGPVSFARGYRLVPMATDEAIIQIEWVRFWTEPEEYERVVMAVDPAVSTQSSADRSAIVVLGKTENAIHCLDATARRVSTPDLVDWMAAVDSAWRPQVIIVEGVSGFGGVVDMLRHQARFGAKVLGIKPSQGKRPRVEAFSVWVRSGGFRLQGEGREAVDPRQRELLDEMITFPVGEHDDLLDAAAMGAAYLMNVATLRVL